MLVKLERPLRVSSKSGITAAVIPAGESVTMERIADGWRVNHDDLVWRARDEAVKVAVGAIEVMAAGK